MGLSEKLGLFFDLLEIVLLAIFLVYVVRVAKMSQLGWTDFLGTVVLVVVALPCFIRLMVVEDIGFLFLWLEKLAKKR